MDSALILHDDWLLVTEDRINAPIKAVCVKVEPFRPGLFAKAFAQGRGRVCGICNAGTGGAAPAGGHTPSTTAAPAVEKKVKAKKEASEESNDDMGFGLSD